jgi:TRAP-type C4-dicarboxylate transport system permease small subunit
MLEKPDSAVNRIEEVLSVVLFVALVVLCTLQIVFRFLINFSLSWTEELAQFVFIVLIYVSCSLAILRDAHVRVEIIDVLVSGRAKYVLDQTVDVVWAVFMFGIGWIAIDIVQDYLSFGKTTPALDWQYGWLYAVIPITFMLMTLRLGQRMYLRHLSWRAERDGNALSSAVE